ncbi:MAG TPA: hypothetical protein VGC63_04830 [Solirubrobacterales bacterium]|jgi:hypothetical protein
MTVTSSAIDGAFLGPGMEARAHNLDQYDPSPGVDSQLERIRALALRLPPSPECEALMAEVDAAIASNLREAEAELAICGAADQLVTDLRHIERNGGNAALSAKAIARHLRTPLAHVSSPDGVPVADLVNARNALSEAVHAIPLLMLLSRAVEHELGAKKFAVLWALAQTNSDAAQCGAAGAAEDRGSGRHGEL